MPKEPIMADTVKLTRQQKAFRAAYTAERKKQELEGVVCIRPEEVHARMTGLSVDEFEALLQQMKEQRLIGVVIVIGVRKSSIPNQRIVIWHE